jgi:hypothetical protein
MTHVRTSAYYPQSNGKLERWHGSLKRECLRPGTPLCLEDARRLVGRYVEHYNEVRPHSAIGYVTPRDRPEGRQQEIWNERDYQPAAARERRRQRRASPATPAAATAAAPTVQSNPTGAEDRATLGSDPRAALVARAAGLGGSLAGRHPSIRLGSKALNPRRQVEKPLDGRGDLVCVRAGIRTRCAKHRAPGPSLGARGSDTPSKSARAKLQLRVNQDTAKTELGAAERRPTAPHARTRGSPRLSVRGLRLAGRDSQRRAPTGPSPV